MSADSINALAAEVALLREALAKAGGALFRLNPACIDDDEEMAKAEHVKAVGMHAVDSALGRAPPPLKDGVAEERQRIKAALMAMHERDKARHNYFLCAVREIFGDDA